MIRTEQVPDEVVLAARIAYEKHMSSREAIAAAINAWPGAVQEQAVFTMDDDCLILPMPQEKNDG